MCNMLEGGLTPMKTLTELKELGFHIVAHPVTGKNTHYNLDD